MAEILVALVFSLLLILAYLTNLDKLFIFVSVITLIFVKYTFGFEKSNADVSLVVLWAIVFYTVLKILTKRALRDKSE